MERKVLLYWIAQVVGWSAYYGFSILLLLSSEEFVPTLNLALWITACILFSVILSHGLRGVILKMDLLSMKLPALLGYTLLFSVVSALILETFQYFLDVTIVLDFLPTDEEDIFDWAIFFLATLRSAILFLVWSGFYYVFVIIEKSRKQEILNLQWQASKNEIELKNLRAQLNPHFLFNSLNSIRALVGINPEHAKTAITQLSGLLRNSINLGKLRTITLKEELELVDNYLKLEQIRFEERLKVQMQVDEQALSSQIPPLMLQTIVENAIKHGISKSLTGGEIAITAGRKNGTLKVLIENTGKLDPAHDETGVGISNTRKRLAILFGEETEFRLYQEGDRVKAAIKITYNE
jgi:two-component system, LytTR family, sensor kinase